jgi:hypothetical protein
MSSQSPAELRKRLLFITFLLGLMAGVGVYLVFKVMQQQNYVLLVALLPMAIAAIPLAKKFRELRKLRDDVAG